MGGAAISAGWNVLYSFNASTLMASTFRGSSDYPGQADQQRTLTDLTRQCVCPPFVPPKLEHRVLVGDRHLYPLTLTRAGSHLQCILSAR